MTAVTKVDVREALYALRDRLTKTLKNGGAKHPECDATLRIIRWLRELTGKETLATLAESDYGKVIDGASDVNF